MSEIRQLDRLDELVERLSSKLVIFTGPFGTGKTEVSMGLAKLLAGRGQEVSLVDLDLVTPYLRPRDLRDRLAPLGVQVVGPEGEVSASDLPSVSEQVAEYFRRGGCGEASVLVDVGGESAGAKVLGMLSGIARAGRYEMLYVFNSRRPDCVSADTARQIFEEIEATARMRITGVVGNTHLKSQTQPFHIVDGARQAQAIAQDMDLPLVFVACREDFKAFADESLDGTPVLPLTLELSFPWE